MFWGVAPNAVLTAAVTGASAPGSYWLTSMKRLKSKGKEAKPCPEFLAYSMPALTVSSMTKACTIWYLHARLSRAPVFQLYVVACSSLT